MKDKSININIHNTNILKKDKKRKRKRRTNTKKYNKKEGVSLGHPTQYKNQPVVTSYPMPSFIGPQMPYNHEAMKHAEDYISPKTPRTQLLLTNGEKEPEKNRNNLLLGDSTTSNPVTTTSTSTKSPLKIKILSPVKKHKPAPVQYTYEGLMKVRTLKELKALMKAAMPDIENSLLNKITNKNKAIAIKQFLKEYDDESTPPASPPPTPPSSPPTTRKSPTPTEFTTQAATTSPNAATTPQQSTPTKFTAQTPTTTDDDDSDHPIRSLHRLGSRKSYVPSNLFNPKTTKKNSEFFDRHKVSKTPGLTTTVKKVQITTPSEKDEKPFENDLDSMLYHELIKDHKDRETRNVIKQLIGNNIGSPAPPIGSPMRTPSTPDRGIFY